MILYPRFGKSAGNLGNQLFQWMSMIGFSKKYNCEFMVPTWKYSQYFMSPPKQYDTQPKIDVAMEEVVFHYNPETFDQYADAFRTKNVSIFGWLQSEKYWIDYKQDVIKSLWFTQEHIAHCESLVPKWVNEKPVIAISVRRGDYVGNSNYELLPIRYYLLALIQHFPDFRENYNIMIFSDDYDYCKLHFQCLPNVWFAEGLSDIEQLAVGRRHATHYIIANSTFSWMMAYLGENPDSKVIRPNFLFAGELLKRNQSKDFYPEHWEILDHKIQRLDLSDVTFTIPVKFDTKDRMENLNLVLRLLQADFHTNFIIGEQGHHRFQYTEETCRYINFTDMQKFHRTKMLNDMAAVTRTNIVVNYDADVVIPPLQIIEAAHKIRTHQADMVYPYDGRFARVPRAKWLKEIDQKVDVGMFGKTMFNGMNAQDAKSVGGCIMYDIQAFMKGGMENENFISYGPEDAERYDRFSKLGFRVQRIPGVLYHFDHVLSIDSGVNHPHFRDNRKELEKIRQMSYEVLRAYVDSWEWCNRYMPLYYESIVEESVKSRDMVFAILEEWGVLKEGMRIVDAGCGLGSWGKDSKYTYTGIDFGVPREKLVIGDYWDDDLRKPLSGLVTKFDLCLCLEVAEHLEPEYADQLIDNLCALSDTILFSAAIPCQGGVNHYNEQWQSYWAEKFKARGYWPNAFDIRDRIWNNKDVALWYRENLMLFHKGRDGMYDITYQLDKIHPEMFMNLMRHYKIIQ